VEERASGAIGADESRGHGEGRASAALGAVEADSAGEQYWPMLYVGLGRGAPNQRLKYAFVEASCKRTGSGMSSYDSYGTCFIEVPGPGVYHFYLCSDSEYFMATGIDIADNHYNLPVYWSPGGQIIIKNPAEHKQIVQLWSGEAFCGCVVLDPGKECEATVPVGDVEIRWGGSNRHCVVGGTSIALVISL
jgi:hypothetical protein